MKKLIIFIIVLVTLMSVQDCTAQNYTRNGNNFSKIESKSITSNSVTTIYTYNVNDTLKAIIHISPKTGRCFIVRTSKNGNEYRQYLPKDICKAICKEMDIEYKEQ